MDTRLRHEVERVSGDVIRFTQDLIRISSPRLHEKELARMISEVMRSLCYDLVFTDDVGNIVGVILGSDPDCAVVVNSHMDTTKPDGLEKWNRSPFSGDIIHGRIEGVGAADCKGGLAAQIYAGHILAASGLRSTGNVVVAATVADENGCSIGVRHLLGTTLPELRMAPKFVILGEPTALAIGTGHDGWVGVDIEVLSPVEGVARSAAEQVFQILGSICDDSGIPESRAIMTIDQPRPEFSGHRFLMTVRICRRLFPGESAEDVVGWLDGPILEMAREMHTVTINVKIHEEEQQVYTGHARRIRLSVPPWSTNLMHPLIDQARKAMRGAGCRWAPRAWILDRLGTGTVGGVVSREFGLPVIGYGPGEEEKAHTCNESVGLSALIEASYGTAVLMEGLSAASLILHPEVVHSDEERRMGRAAEGGFR